MKTNIRLGESVKSKVDVSVGSSVLSSIWGSVYNSVDISARSSAIGLINDSVWGSVESSVRNSITNKEELRDKRIKSILENIV